MELINEIKIGEFWVNDFTIESLNYLITSAVKNNKKIIVAHHNLHSLFLAFENPRLKNFYDRSDYIHIDGMSIVVMCKFLGYSIQRINRITYIDWFNPLLSLCNNQKWKVFYLGSKPEVAKIAIERLRIKYSSVIFEYHPGYFNVDGDDNNQVINQINSFKPDILFVGMGMPRQEFWIEENFSKVNSKIFLPCGACFDYIANAIHIPPRWMGQIGLEWLFRLIDEPHRLFKRYIIEPFFLLYYFSKSFFKRH